MGHSSTYLLMSLCASCAAQITCSPPTPPLSQNSVEPCSILLSVPASCKDLSACRVKRSTAAGPSSSSGAPLDSLLSLQYSKTEKPNKEDETHVVVMMQALHAQICPAVAQATAALVAHCMQASKPHTASGECASTVPGTSI